MPKRDLYSILGLDIEATDEQIRDAYVARARVMHPDRFDRQRQYQDWKKANEMLSELNEAYTILKDPESKREYDKSRNTLFAIKENPGTRAEKVYAESGSVDLNEFAPGWAAFGDLPMYTRQRLLDRQNDRMPEQFRLQIKSIYWNYFFMLILLCWFGYIFANVNTGKWTIAILAIYSINTIITGFLIGYNVNIIIQWITSTLKPFFYITPLYFIRTGFDTVSFTPIWNLKHISTNRHYKYGVYRTSEILLTFEGYGDKLRLASANKVEAVFDHVRTYDARFRKQFTVNNRDYFNAHDDFARVIRTNRPAGGQIQKSSQTTVYLLSVAICFGGLIAAVILNGSLSQKWFEHVLPQTNDNASSRTATKQLIPEQPVPETGVIHKQTTDKPSAPFRIIANEGNHHLLKLIDSYSGEEVISLFVRSGSTAEVQVPFGVYEVRYASGKKWYGYRYLFGPDTVYSKADKILRFETTGNRIEGYTMTLHQVTEGNLQTRGIKPEEF
ncbi:MAG TPA: J domain-containing protein [Syntrophorhabdaceae bacterium]|nr:J domain-containing protein [Syntrophorhabdaceae bacterium]